MTARFEAETNATWPSIKDEGGCVVYVSDMYVNLVFANSGFRYTDTFEKTVKLMREAWCV